MSENFSCRRSIRLKGYDYSQSGAYFITVCLKGRLSLLGHISGGRIILSDLGHIVEQKIREMPEHYDVEIDTYCIMPNHIHIILVLVGAGPRACPQNNINTKPQNNNPNPTISAQKIVIGSTRGSTPTVGEYVKRLKTITSRDRKLWQRNYYEHIIRDNGDLHRIREYIINNSLNWQNDKLYVSPV